MVGVATVLEALQRSAETNQVTLTTNTLSGSTTHDLQIDKNDDKVDTVNFKPSDATLPDEGILYMVRPIVSSGSTDTDLFIYEDSDRESIDEVLRIEGLSTNDGTQTFQPGSGTGIPFQNQNDKEEWYLTLDELSGNDSQYEIRLRWFDVT